MRPDWWALINADGNPTPFETAEELGDFLESQGLPRTCEDPAVIDRVARILAAATGVWDQ